MSTVTANCSVAGAPLGLTVPTKVFTGVHSQPVDVQLTVVVSARLGGMVGK